MIIVIDGPAGAGKSSTAKAVARKAGINYIDSGAIYRAFTVLYLRGDKSKKKFFEQLDNAELQFVFDEDKASVIYAGEDITDLIRSHKVNDHVSEVAAMPEVRKKVLSYLRNIAGNRDKDFIAEGRDLGSVVFPDADLKFFLTADLEVRAKRRLLEAKDGDLNQVKENLKSRDHKDSTRTEAPLIKAEDAIEIDTTGLTFQMQVERILKKIRSYNMGNTHEQKT